MSALIFYLAIICLLFGIAYPALSMLVYPFYKLFGGEMTFVEYVRCL